MPERATGVTRSFLLVHGKKYSLAELTPRGPFLRIAAMKIIPVLCQRCGAPLDVADESVRFVTCAHCSTPLEIVREATQSHSRILEQIQAATQDHGRRLKVIELQNELSRLDRDWNTYRERACGRNKDGSISDSPVARWYFWLGLVTIFGGYLSFGMITSSKSSGMMWLLPILVVALSFYIIRQMTREHRAFRRSEHNYMTFRASLLNQLAQMSRK